MIKRTYFLFFCLLIYSQSSLMASVYNRLRPRALENFFSKNIKDTLNLQTYSFMNGELYRTIQADDFVSSPETRLKGVVDSDDDFLGGMVESGFQYGGEEVKEVRSISIDPKSEGTIRYRKTVIELFLSRFLLSEEIFSFDNRIVETLSLELFLINYADYFAEQSFSRKCQLLKKMKKTMKDRPEGFLSEGIMDEWQEGLTLANDLIIHLKNDPKADIVCNVRPIISPASQEDKAKGFVMEVVIESLRKAIREKTELVKELLEEYENLVKDISQKTYTGELIKLRDSLITIQANLKLVKDDLFCRDQVSGDCEETLLMKLESQENAIKNIKKLSQSDATKKEKDFVKGVEVNIHRYVNRLLGLGQKLGVKSCQNLKLEAVVSCRDGVKSKIDACLKDLKNKAQELIDSNKKDEYWSKLDKELYQLSESIAKLRRH